ncbi:PfkB family carbohydrate kinase [Alkaliphilus peptidifermentans]|uniref:Fructoselysine 6-kinase n=1 Tax=Alkaliphilus peptidifermentans DSM 18978 TaxID=1120976 RepID=A0A1G5HL37_9FIRM|nr:PfkB family carbohydrate kinase [Alkaliphilus peptidifermentans]SCY64575.1 fructoselysine 6-kinase [Alkaliphilus peptidifermentans DSM 18978]
MKVVAVGDNMLDFYSNLQKKYLGGNAINFIMNLQQDTAFHLSYVGPIASDKAGIKLMSTLKENSVDINYSNVIEGNTPLSTVEVKDGERAFNGLEMGVLEGFYIDNHQIEFIKGHSHIHTSIMGGIINQLKDIHGYSSISFDFSILRNKRIITEALKYIDYAFYSGTRFEKEEEDMLLEACSFGARHAVFLQGKVGSRVYDGNKLYFHSAEKGRVIDTLGAGDSFIAGYMSVILKGGSIKQAMEIGTQWAFKTCSHHGGFLINGAPVEV